MSEPYVGQIIMFGGNFAPRNWAFCDGSLLAIAENDALFALIGTTYGGDGRTTFGLPDLRGRIPLHQGQGAGLSNYVMGQKAGTQTVALNITQMPPHSHNVTARMRAESRPGSVTEPAGQMLAAGSSIFRPNAAADDVNMDPAMVSVTQNTVGNGNAFDNMPPFQAVSYIIALFGIFPSRN